MAMRLAAAVRRGTTRRMSERMRGVGPRTEIEPTAIPRERIGTATELADAARQRARQMAIQLGGLSEQARPHP